MGTEPVDSPGNLSGAELAGGTTPAASDKRSVNPRLLRLDDPRFYLGVVLTESVFEAIFVL
jgi:hypothetical protein